jgi:hypothetical protein
MALSIRTEGTVHFCSYRITHTIAWGEVLHGYVVWSFLASTCLSTIDVFAIDRHKGLTDQTCIQRNPIVCLLSMGTILSLQATVHFYNHSRCIPAHTEKINSVSRKIDCCPGRSFLLQITHAFEILATQGHT